MRRVASVSTSFAPEETAETPTGLRAARAIEQAVFLDGYDDASDQVGASLG
jgi:hypothetical protein